MPWWSEFLFYIYIGVVILAVAIRLLRRRTKYNKWHLVLPMMFLTAFTVPIWLVTYYIGELTEQILDYLDESIEKLEK